MNAGVRIAPCGVAISPRRAPASVAMRRKPKPSTIVFLVVDRRAGGLLVERLAIADAAAQELGPRRNSDRRVELFREQRPQGRMMPAQLVPRAIPVGANAPAQLAH